MLHRSLHRRCSTGTRPWLQCPELTSRQAFSHSPACLLQNSNTRRNLAIARTAERTILSEVFGYMKRFIKYGTGRVRQVILATGTFVSIAFSLFPSSAAQPESTARLIEQLGSAVFREREVASEKLARRGEAVLPDLRRAALSSSDLEIRRRAAFLIEEIDHRLCRPVRRFGTAIWCLRYSPDGRKAAASGAWGTVWVWDVDTGKDVALLKHEQSVSSIALDPDGHRLLTGSHDGIMRLWDLSSQKPSRSFLRHPKHITGVAFSPDGKQALSCSDDESVRLWDVDSGEELRCDYVHRFAVSSADFSPDGKTIVSTGWDARARIRAVDSGEELCAFEGHNGGLDCAVFAPDGKRVLTGSVDHSIRLWDARTGKELRCLRGHQQPVSHVAFTSHGRRAVSVSTDGTARLWDLESGKELRCQHKQKKAVYALALSPNGQQALFAGEEGIVWLWQLPQEE